MFISLIAKAITAAKRSNISTTSLKNGYDQKAPAIMLLTKTTSNKPDKTIYKSSINFS